MQTPWGDIAVWDAHTHLFSQSFFEALNKQRPSESRQSVEQTAEGLGWEPPGSNSELAARWVAELDRQGVDRTILMASVPGDETAAGEVVRSAPERLFGYFMLNPIASDAEARAVSAFDDLGLRGMCLFPAMQRFSVHDTRLEPLYRLVAERPGTLVFVHMGVLTVGVRKKLGLASPFDMSFSNPVDLHRIAAERPQVNFVLPHFGAGYFREALMLCDLCPNVYLDTSSSNSWTKFLSPQPTLEEVFERALDVAGPDRLRFGSDSSFFPRGWNRAVFDRQVEALENVGIDGQAASKIFGGNLQRLLLSRAQS